MTFDDGPKFGADVTKLFDSVGGKATFFFNELTIENSFSEGIYDHAEELQERYAAGHQIAAHVIDFLTFTWSHSAISTLSPEQLEEEFALLEVALDKILGLKPKYFRPPFSSYNAASLSYAESRGYTGELITQLPTFSSRGPG
ncbi:hypothetical protein P7C70_g1526, partial [Phenoliferia sp. Uapishka_3]